jgi:hypothetical protein
VAWDWISPVGSGLVGVAGVAFGWATAVGSRRQTAELAREGNRHAQALADTAGEQARRLEELRHEQAGRDRRERRLEESYLEIATIVIRLSAAAPEEGGTMPDVPEELVRASVLVGLFAPAAVREAFDKWLDRFDKLRYAVARRSAKDGTTPESTRDLHSPRDMWRRQATDARLKEIDARERLLQAMSRHLDES